MNTGNVREFDIFGHSECRKNRKNWYQWTRLDELNRLVSVSILSVDPIELSSLRKTPVCTFFSFSKCIYLLLLPTCSIYFRKATFNLLKNVSEKSHRKDLHAVKQWFLCSMLPGKCSPRISQGHYFQFRMYPDMWKTPVGTQIFPFFEVQYIYFVQYLFITTEQKRIRFIKINETHRIYLHAVKHSDFSARGFPETVLHKSHKEDRMNVPCGFPDGRKIPRSGNSPNRLHRSKSSTRNHSNPREKRKP